MSIALFLFFGVVVGAVAQAMKGLSGAREWLVSMSIGVVGALLGGLFGVALGLHDGQPASAVMALGGATMLVVLERVRTGRHDIASGGTPR